MSDEKGNEGEKTSQRPSGSKDQLNVLNAYLLSDLTTGGSHGMKWRLGWFCCSGEIP